MSTIKHSAATDVSGRRLGGTVGMALGRSDGQRPARWHARRPRDCGEPHQPESSVSSGPAPEGPDVFEGERPRLTGLAYRITGSLADAEDVVQEAWLRREAYVGPWRPDPVPTARSVEETAELAESLTLAFLILLDSLGPSERVAFLLGDVFGEPYPVIAEALGKSEPTCRQLVSRARRKMHQARTDGRAARPAPASAELLAQLMDSVLAGDEGRALRLLDPDVVLISDAGPARHAARRPVAGAERVRQYMEGVWRLLGLKTRPSRGQLPPARLLDVNSSPSLVLDWPEGPIVITAEALNGRITSIWVRLNPDKTAALQDPPPVV